MTIVGYRKYSVAVLALLSLYVLTWFSKIDPGVYATGLVATVGAYLTSNVLQKKTNP